MPKPVKRGEYGPVIAERLAGDWMLDDAAGGRYDEVVRVENLACNLAVLVETFECEPTRVFDRFTERVEIAAANGLIRASRGGESEAFRDLAVREILLAEFCRARVPFCSLSGSRTRHLDQLQMCGKQGTWPDLRILESP